MSDCLFDLHIGYISFRNPIALAPMAGIVDSAFANQYAGDAGLVILGAFNLDKLQTMLHQSSRPGVEKSSSPMSPWSL